MLRDLRTRFGGSALGFLVAVGWPLVHMVFMAAAFLLRNSTVPIGGDPVIYALTGLIPYIVCLYPARIIMMVIPSNKGLLYFPIINIQHLLVARCLVEFLTAFLIVGIVGATVALLGSDIRPLEPGDAAAAIISAVYLSTCIGVFSAIIFAVFPFWQVVFIVCMIAAYLSSGALIPIDSTSNSVFYLLWYNPLFHCVEWLRSAYYIDSSFARYSPAYLFWISTLFLFLGLVGERFLRGRLLV